MTIATIRVFLGPILAVAFLACGSTGEHVYESGSRRIPAKAAVDLVVDGVFWKQVSSLEKVGPEDRVYSVRVDNDGSTVITFGDGQHGARIPAGSSVRATYRYGGGHSSDEMTISWRWMPRDTVEELALCARIRQRDGTIEFQRRPRLGSSQKE
jgi:hypothetical protein